MSALNKDKELWTFTEMELKKLIDSFVDEYAEIFDGSSMRSIQEKEVYAKLKTRVINLERK